MSQVQTQVNKDKANLDIIRRQLAEAENTSRLVSNTINLIGEMDIKAAYAKPVYEVQMFWEQFHKGIETQIAMMKQLLPVEPEVVAGNTVAAQQGSNTPETPAAEDPKLEVQ